MFIHHPIKLRSPLAVRCFPLDLIATRNISADPELLASSYNERSSLSTTNEIRTRSHRRDLIDSNHNPSYFFKQINRSNFIFENETVGDVGRDVTTEIATLRLARMRQTSILTNQFGRFFPEEVRDFLKISSPGEKNVEMSNTS